MKGDGNKGEDYFESHPAVRMSMLCLDNIPCPLKDPYFFPPRDEELMYHMHNEECKINLW